jgi:hypothetical protein
MYLSLALNLQHFLLDLGALYALRPTFMKSTPVLTIAFRVFIGLKVKGSSG